MTGSAWRSYWGVFAGLVVAIALMAGWWVASAPVRPPAAMADRAAALPTQKAELQQPVRAADGLVVPAGFMRAPSGRLLPRFATLAERTAVRLGPGMDYPVAWIIRSSGLPLEVLAEAGEWVRIRDHEGEEGWIPARVLDGLHRSALVAPWRKDARLALRASAADSAPLKAWVGSRVVVQVLACDGRWCRVRAGSVTGWLRQPQLWGVYRDERIDVANDG